MQNQRKRYSEGHWLRSHDSEKVLAAYLEQQSKAYSRIKNAYVKELLGDLRNKRFLDYGCGGGMFTVHAAQQGALEVVGVDAEGSALEAARYFARREGVDRLCSFVRSDRFPVLAKRPKFDAILMKDVLEHVEDDQGLLCAAAEAVVPGGLLVVSTQNSLSLNYLIQGTYRRRVLGEKNWCGWDETHVRFYTPMSLNRKLAKAGFTSEGWRSVYVIPYKLPGVPGSGKEFLRIDLLSWIDKALGGVFPYNRLGWNVIVRARASSVVPQRAPLTSPIEAVPGSPMPAVCQSLRFF
ncbi:MAG: class I SAM-dependent methyltransferase [Desulfomonilaceae bacterium]|nr:class I SAM-dependent methyltransferase [Desulfomonilaceae bacterium]